MTLAPVHDLGPASEWSDTQVVLSKFLRAKYNDFCGLQAMAHNRACCPKGFFINEEATVLSEMGCDLMIIPETMPGAEYYNPLFINDDEKQAVENTGIIVKLQNLYRETTNKMRGKRQIGLTIEGWSMFGFAVNAVLNCFGYSTTTSKDVKHIKAYQQHLAQVGGAQGFGGRGPELAAFGKGAGESSTDGSTRYLEV